jgi:Tfp pilus assembly protein PilF
MVLKNKYYFTLCSTLIVSLVSACSSPAKKPLSHDERAGLLLQVANGALIEGDPTGALGTLMQANAEDPNIPEIHHSMALAYYAKNDLSSALREVETAVKLAPNYADANNTLGKILVDSGRYGEAAAPLTKAAENPLYREAYKAWTNLGILYYRKGDLTKASDYFARAIQTSREEACIAHYYSGHLKLREGNYSEAIHDYKQATEKTCAGFADAHLAIAITYERTKQYDMARRSYLQVEQRFPNTKAADQAFDHLKGLP